MYKFLAWSDKTILELLKILYLTKVRKVCFSNSKFIYISMVLSLSIHSHPWAPESRQLVFDVRILLFNFLKITLKHNKRLPSFSDENISEDYELKREISVKNKIIKNYLFILIERNAIG